MYKQHLEHLKTGPLSLDDAYSIGQFILSGDANDMEIASLLTALMFQDISYELLAGFSQAMKLYSKDLPDQPYGLMDVCGTGGDHSGTFNISTTVSILLSSVIKIAKHGNRSITSKSGSSDVLRILKIPFYDEPKQLNEILRSYNYAFLHAPSMHPHMKYVMPVRTALKTPTIFNMIGPLCNPLKLDYQVVGVYKEELLLPIAKTLQHFGIKRAAVVHGHGGLDELSLSGSNQVVYIFNNKIVEDTIHPLDFGIPVSELEAIKGGDATLNASIMTDILMGKKGPKQDVIALNAGLCLFVAEQVFSLKDGIQMAYQMLNSQLGYSQLIKIQGV